MAHPDPAAPDRLTLLVAAPARWELVAVPAERSGPVDRARAGDQLGLTVRAEPDGEALAADVRVRSTGAWAGTVAVDEVLVEVADGRVVALDAHDLDLLGALGEEPRPVGELQAATGIASAPVRLARLVDAALARSAAPVEDRLPAEDPADGAAQHEEAPVTGAEAPDPGPEGAVGDGSLSVTPQRGRSWWRRRPRSEQEHEAPVSPTRAKVPVYAVWHRDVGPLLSLGMLTAAARAHADLVEAYEIRPPEDAESVLADLAARPGPAVLLCSDYVWSSASNLATAQRAVELNPELLVVHGGPSAPKYPGDAEAFLRTWAPVAHVLCRGEGERQIVDLLRALLPGGPRVDRATLEGVAGLAFIDPETGAVVRTAEPERIADLDSVPSPYLTGEFDHIDPGAWHYALSIESNRGCPYGCTFCDWGSSTLSRIRKFSLERVAAEVEWAAGRGVPSITIADANFGIMSRDVEIARAIADTRRRSSHPEWVSFTPAKNTTKHLIPIMDEFRRAGVVPTMSISLQTIDEPTLDAIERRNISTQHFLELAADHRRHGHPLQSDLLLGMPEQTFDSYRRDLQFNLDHEILVRTWPVQLLPNAPMNDPAYRERHGIVADEHGVVLSTNSLDEADLARMYRLRRAHVTFEVFGLLRHSLRYLQWDHGIEGTVVMDHLLGLVDRAPERIPHIEWILTYFDIHTLAPGGWSAFYDEFRQVVVDDLGVPPSSELETVLALDQHLMPILGRRFPDTIELPHDYVAYYRSAVAPLYREGNAGLPERPLGSYGPTSFTVLGDPLELCTEGARLAGDSRDGVLQGDFYTASASAFELHSTLSRMLPHMARTLGAEEVARIIADTLGGPPEAPTPRDAAPRAGIPVMLRGAR
ncbi:MAG TPA: radical SAM protein [Acidimicrobiales bacterium]|nr:radical SAM protein [Acidimicrobiales bacterium]